MEQRNDIWGLLGLTPTNDKKAIKKAFAAQAKLHHPEEEPEYFAALNQAYKAALASETTTEEDGIHRETKDIYPVTKKAQEAPEHSQAPGKDGDKSENRQQDYAKTKETEKENALREKEPESSLLKLLDQAAEQSIKKSMEAGALHDFIVLFENPKQAKQADTWKRFFLSEAFLGEQFSEEFGKGLLTYLSKQSFCPGDNLPMGLLQELAIAYAFIPHFAGEEYFDGLKYPKEWYKVSVENTFPGRKYAAEIFNMQGRECDLKSMTNRILRQPANKVRHNAFSDYLAMKEMSRDGRLTDGEKDIWQHILGICQPFYLYERNGKRIGTGDYEARSECVVKLYVQWLKDESLPQEVLLFLYKKLDFKDLERSSTRGLYGALKAEVLRRLPRAEEILFGEDGKEQRITKLYRIYSAIINDNESNYDKFIYEETPEIRDRARAFFALPEWEALKKEKEMFERIYGVSKRVVMPRTVAETLVEYLAEGDFPESKKTELAESLLRSLSMEKMCRELDYHYEIDFPSVNPEDLGSSPDFWQYFLMRGFGFRHAKIRGSWEEDFLYVMEGQCYLPAYINYIYAPSRAWQRRFLGFDEEKEEIQTPVCMVCPMPGNRSLRVEFHYRYCLYFVDGIQVDGPVLAFSRLQETAEELKRPQEFFFLLAVTAVEDSDRSSAQTLIEDWLRRIPIHPFIIPTVARLLAADNDRVPGAVPGPAETVPTAAEEQNSVYAETAQNMTDEKDPAAGCSINVETVLYSEQERFGFRAVVSENGLSVWGQMDYSWQDIIFRRAELGWRKWEEYTWNDYNLYIKTRHFTEQTALGNPDEGLWEGNIEEGRLPAAGTDTPEGRKAAALNVLQGLRQPRPQIRAVYSLEGMDTAQKAEKILEAMGCPENMEGYCVLRYGEKKERRHDRVFYGAFAPFGFDLKAHSAAHVRTRNYLMASSNTKIKEPKLLLARFGWGFKYLPRSDYGPMYVYRGESGKFYAYGPIRMHRADSLEQLLADFFRQEWEGVTEVEVYEGSLTVSRMDHRLEYCYTEEDLRLSMHSVWDTAADRFTLFGGYGMWMEFVRWMDGMLNPKPPSWVNVIVVGLDWEKGGALTFAGIHEDDTHDEIEEFQEDDMDFEDAEEERGAPEPAGSTAPQQNEVYLPRTPLLIWAKGMDRRDRGEFLANALQWYVNCGKFAENTEGRNIRIVVNGNF